MSIIDTAKAHPYMTAGLAVAGVIIFYVVSHSSGSQAVTVAAQPSSGSGDALAAAQLQANVQSQGISAGVQANQDNINGQLQLAAMAQALQFAQVNAGEQVNLAGLKTQTDLATIQTQGQVDIANISRQAQQDQINGIISLAGLQSHVAETQITSANDLEMLRVTTAGNLASQQQTNAYNAHIFDTWQNANLTNIALNNQARQNEINYSETMTLAPELINASLANNQINANTAVALGNIQLAGLQNTNAARVDIASTNANAAITSTAVASAGNLVKAIGSFI